MTKDIATVKAALECTVEHLEGEHEGKVVVSADVFNTLYDFAETALSSPPAIDDLGELLKRVPDKRGCELRKGGTSGQWAFKIFSMTADTIYGEGTTPAEAVRKAMEKMEEGE